MPTRLWFLFVFNCCMICCCETGMLGATAEPGRPTNSAPISFSAWNSAHHRPRKVTPILSPSVNATQMYHIHDSRFAGICFPHFSQSSRFQAVLGTGLRISMPTRGPTRSLRGDTRFPVRTLEFSAHPRFYVFIAGGRSLTFTKPITVAPQTV